MEFIYVNFLLFLFTLLSLVNYTYKRVSIINNEYPYIFILMMMKMKCQGSYINGSIIRSIYKP